MSKTRLTAFLLPILLFAATASFAHEEKHVIKLKVAGDDDVIVVDDLEVGETRQVFTDSGKEVVVTREENGYELSVDGREIDVVSPGDHHGTAEVTIDGESGEKKVDLRVKKVIKVHDGENVFFFSGDEGEDEEGNEVLVWTGDGEEGESHATVSIGMDVKSVADRVLESGVLDKLDEATRQEILDEIEKAEKHRVIRTGTKTIVFDKEEER